MIDVIDATEEILRSIDSQINQAKRSQGNHVDVINALLIVRETASSIKSYNEKVRQRGWY
jgi:hypothetical protein